MLNYAPLNYAQRVVQLVNEISTASEEQANGIDQIGKTVQQMDQVTQQNAANAEQTAAASEELTAQALNDLVDKVAREVNAGGGETGEERRPVAVQTSGKRQAMPAERTAAAGKKKPALRGDGRKMVQAKTAPRDIIPMEDGDLSDF